MSFQSNIVIYFITITKQV